MVKDWRKGREGDDEGGRIGGKEERGTMKCGRIGGKEERGTMKCGGGGGCHSCTIILHTPADTLPIPLRGSKRPEH